MTDGTANVGGEAPPRAAGPGDGVTLTRAVAGLGVVDSLTVPMSAEQARWVFQCLSRILAALTPPPTAP